MHMFYHNFCPPLLIYAALDPTTGICFLLFTAHTIDLVLYIPIANPWNGMSGMWVARNMSHPCQ